MGAVTKSISGRPPELNSREVRHAIILYHKDRRAPPVVILNQLTTKVSTRTLRKVFFNPVNSKYGEGYRAFFFFSSSQVKMILNDYHYIYIYIFYLQHCCPALNIFETMIGCQFIFLWVLGGLKLW
jgi:hypothetical protein